jgi:ABC-type ATPase with predicted acetyltransferase domain
MRIHLHHEVRTSIRPTPRVLAIASMFGLAVDEPRPMTIVPPVAIDLPLADDTGGVVLITGPSGGGKSTLLRLIARACAARDRVVLALDPLAPLPDVSLIDALDGTLEEAAAALARAGLGDAVTMLRRPSELSEGQRHRAMLARLMLEAERVGGDEPRARASGAVGLRCDENATAPALALRARSARARPGQTESSFRGAEHARADRPSAAAPAMTTGRIAQSSDPAHGARVVIVADELGATLDRLTAQIIARQIARWARAAGHLLLCATAHDDLLEALAPDLLIWKGLSDELEVMSR